MGKCIYDLAWRGQCSKYITEGDFCDEHKGIKCCSCGAQATKQCPETFSLVCGAPLCDDCEHTTQSNGCNSGGKLPEGLKGHCKKDEQVYKPWYQRDKDNPKDIYLHREPITTEEILEHFGWSIDCKSPYEISHTDGSFASGQAASYLVESLKKEYEDKVL